METEIWKDIIGYEGLYHASNLGKIKAIRKIRTFGKYSNNTRIYEEKIMKPNKTKNGYLIIQLSKDGVQKWYSVHRLIAKTYLENFENKSQVNHINCIKTDNKVLNLEWCTASENINHAIKNNLLSNLFTSKNNPSSKRVINIVTNKIYNSITEAATENNIPYKKLWNQINVYKNNNSNFKLCI